MAGRATGLPSLPLAFPLDAEARRAVLVVEIEDQVLEHPNGGARQLGVGLEYFLGELPELLADLGLLLPIAVRLSLSLARCLGSVPRAQPLRGYP